MKLDNEIKLDFDPSKIDQAQLVRYLLITTSLATLVISIIFAFTTFRAINQPAPAASAGTQAINQPLFQQAIELINQSTSGLPR